LVWSVWEFEVGRRKTTFLGRICQWFNKFAQKFYDFVKVQNSFDQNLKFCWILQQLYRKFNNLVKNLQKTVKISNFGFKVNSFVESFNNFFKYLKKIATILSKTQQLCWSSINFKNQSFANKAIIPLKTHPWIAAKWLLTSQIWILPPSAAKIFFSLLIIPS
jgi:hypothetical protein